MYMLIFHWDKRAKVRLEFDSQENKPAGNSCGLFNQIEGVKSESDP